MVSTFCARSTERTRLFLLLSAPGVFLGGWKMPHAPFGAPSHSYDLYEPISKRVPLAANRYRPRNAPNIALITDFFLRNGTDTLENGHVWGPDRPVEDYVARLNRQAYYAAVTYTDEQIGRVLKELDALGLTNDTLVIMHADRTLPCFFQYIPLLFH